MIKPIFILFLSLSKNFTYAQNCNCNDILQYGVYNHFSKSDRIESKSKLQTAVSNSFKQQKSETEGGGIGFKGITGNYSQGEAKAIEKIVNTKKLDENDLKVINESGSTFISEEMMKSYRACLKLCTGGIETKTNFPDDGRFEEIVIELKYRKPPKVEVFPKITEVDFDSTCYSCFGELLALKTNKEPMKEDQPYALTCRRKIIQTPYILIGTENDLIRAKEALIQIKTDFDNYYIRIPHLYARNPERLKGIGEIVSTMLTKEEFLEANGKKYWMLADGTEAPQGSEYRKYIDEKLPYMNGKVPDLRGRFLRGFNNGKSINPDNNNLGTKQEDAIEKHTHTNKL